MEYIFTMYKNVNEKRLPTVLGRSCEPPHIFQSV